jgi:hypothetical protein
MSWTKIGLLLVFVLLLTSGQVLFKAAAESIKGNVVGFDVQTLLKLAFNSYLLLGLAIYAASTLLWVLLLRDAELSRVYLAVALALCTSPASGNFFLWRTVDGPPTHRNVNYSDRTRSRPLVTGELVLGEQSGIGRRFSCTASLDCRARLQRRGHDRGGCF